MATIEKKKEKEEQVAVESARPQGALTEYLDEVLQDAGLGTENITMAEKATPYFTIIQKNSPQVDLASELYMENARQGQILNTVTGELHDEILIANCGLLRQMVEWVSRDKGGGFVAAHQLNDPMLLKTKKNTRNQPVPIESPDNVIIDTVYHFVSHFRDDQMPDAGVISMASTQHKKSRLWVTEFDKEIIFDKEGKPHKAPSFLNLYKATTEIEKKDKFSWFGWKFEKVGPLPGVNLGWYRFARDFAKLVAAGQVRVSAPPEPVVESEQSSDDVPF